jgi:cytochrome P450
VTETSIPDVGRDIGGCPVVHYDFSYPRPILTFFSELDDLREQGPAYWNTHGPGYWVLTRYDEVREAYQNPTVFSSDSIDPLDPDPAYRFIPTLVNPPDHVKYRQVLNPWFAPAAVNRITPLATKICVDDLRSFAGRGSCDFIADFALKYPTEVFLTILGLPVEDAPLFLPWVETFFEGLYGEDKSHIPDVATAIRGYFADILAARRTRPADPSTDFVTYLMNATVFGRPLREDELLDICFVLVLAGLDTTRGQLGYLFRHLATHDEDRRRVVGDPTIIPGAVEETLRLYSIIIGDGRKLAQDIDFHGCPMKKGDMVWLSAVAANRDPRVFPNAGEFVPDRRGNTHLGFAAGPHRCLGSHLARREMIIAAEEWHKLIPEYRLASDAPILERGGMLSLFSLPLAWDV